VFLELSTLLREGIQAGDFRRVDPFHFIPSMISVIVFHFNTAPIMKFVTGKDAMSPQLMAARREAVLEFISAALSTSQKEHG
jgi:hypothetical protein